MSNDPAQFDSLELRRALSCFATGVAVATTRDGSGEPAGITINSFNSVSLDPPLVLWSIARDSYSYDAFINAEYFAVNVLAREQQDLSERFAQRNGDKFEGIVTRAGLHDIPLLSDCAACFQCSTEHLYEGGDHIIIVGRVLSIEEREAEPLIFYRSDYLPGPL